MFYICLTCEGKSLSIRSDEHKTTVWKKSPFFHNDIPFFIDHISQFTYDLIALSIMCSIL